MNGLRHPRQKMARRSTVVAIGIVLASLPPGSIAVASGGMYQVTKVDPTGVGSLSAAIGYANSNPGTTITFASSVGTIAPRVPCPRSKHR